MTEWREQKLSDFMDFNPYTPLSKGIIAKKVTMEKLIPFNRKIQGYEDAVFSGGTKFKNGDTLVARITPCLENGKTAYVDFLNDEEVAFGSTEFIVLRAKEGISDSRFIFYFAISDEFRDTAIQLMSGTSGRQRVDTEALKRKVFTLPPLPEQKAIAEVLSSLDDKIDLLTKQNKTLEDLAQAYFRKWFIEDASDEWEIKKLRDFGEIICGKTPPTTNKKFFNGNIPFIKIPDMHNNVYIFDTADTLSEMGAKYQENKFIPPMSICVSCIATVGLVSMNVFLSQTNQQINSLIPKHDKYRYYLFLFLRSYRDELLALGSGGTMTLNINKTLFGDIECYCPDDEILFRFNNVVNPLFGKIYNNCKQIRILSKLRNTLLPKLISGEIRVKM
jgi:type I restriction enzyme S subunit